MSPATTLIDRVPEFEMLTGKQRCTDRLVQFRDVGSSLRVYLITDEAKGYPPAQKEVCEVQVCISPLWTRVKRQLWYREPVSRHVLQFSNRRDEMDYPRM